MQDVDIIKAELRKDAISRRRNINKSEKLFADIKISETLFSLQEFINAKRVFIYVSKDEETDTERIINYSLYCKKTVAVPKCIPAERLMNFYEIKSIDELVVGYKGIREPDINGVVLVPNRDDIAIIPMLCADKRLNRLGYGGGYYDIYLADNPCISVGLCYSMNIYNNVPRGDFDVPMNIVITENGIYRREEDYGK